MVDKVKRKMRGRLEDTLALDMGVRTTLNDMSTNGIPVAQRAWREDYEVARVSESDLPGKRSHQTQHSERLRQRRRSETTVQARLSHRFNKAAELRAHSDVDGIGDLIEWRKVQAFVNDTGKNILGALEKSTDGRVHPKWNVLGTVTGRITSDGPNLLGVARSHRKHFVPDPGNVFLLVTSRRRKFESSRKLLATKP